MSGDLSRTDLEWVGRAAEMEGNRVQGRDPQSQGWDSTPEPGVEGGGGPRKPGTPPQGSVVRNSHTHTSRKQNDTVDD